MKEDIRFSSTSDCHTLGLGEKKPIFNTCPVCGGPLCEHGLCSGSIPNCPECHRSLDPYSIVMDAMKHISIVSGPAMGMAEYRAFCDAMKIFSIATREIWEAK